MLKSQNVCVHGENDLGFLPFRVGGNMGTPFRCLTFSCNLVLEEKTQYSIIHKCHFKYL